VTSQLIQVKAGIRREDGMGIGCNKSSMPFDTVSAEFLVYTTAKVLGCLYERSSAIPTETEGI
jgi:hypothetical protein